MNAECERRLKGGSNASYRWTTNSLAVRLLTVTAVAISRAEHFSFAVNPEARVGVYTSALSRLDRLTVPLNAFRSASSRCSYSDCEQVVCFTTPAT